MCSRSYHLLKSSSSAGSASITVISIPFPESGMRLLPCNPLAHDTVRQRVQSKQGSETHMPINSKYVFVASMDVDLDKEALFNEVYDTEHVPNLLSVPGVHAARLTMYFATLD